MRRFYLLLLVSLPIVFNSCKGFEVEPIDGLEGNADSSSLSTPIQDLQAIAISDLEIKLTFSLIRPGNYAFSIFRNDKLIATTPNTYFSDVGLDAGSTYTYKVYASDIDTGKGYPSTVVVASTFESSSQPPTDESVPMPQDPSPNFDETVAMYSYNSDLSNAKVLEGATLDRQKVYFFFSNENNYRSIRFYCCKGLSGDALSDSVETTIIEDASAPFVISKDMSELLGGERELYVDATLNDSSGDYDSISTGFSLKDGDISQPVDPPPPMENDSSTEAYYTETFDSGGKTNSNGFSWANSAGVSSDHSYSGNYALKFSYGPDASGEDSSSEQRFVIAQSASAAPREMWIEYMLRIPNNFEHRAQSPNNNKLISLWAENYSRSGDIQTVFEYERSDSTKSHLRVLCMSGSGCLKGSFSSHIIDTSMRGKWIRIRIHVKAGANGAVEMWRDNTKVYSIYNYQHYFNGGNNYWRKGYLMGWSNSGYSSVTNFYIDDFKIYTKNPNWSF